MAYPDSMKIEMTRIVIYFTPPDTGPKPARKPRTPIPLIDRIFRNADELFDGDEFFVEDDVHGTL